MERTLEMTPPCALGVREQGTPDLDILTKVENSRAALKSLEGGRWPAGEGVGVHFGGKGVGLSS